MYPYLHTANAKELTGKDRIIFRILEIIPGAVAWTTLLGMILASWLAPIAAAIFIILFDLYWLIKTVYLSVHLRGNWKRVMHNLKIDWRERVDKLKWDHVWQIVILPFYKESFEVSDGLLSSVATADWPKDRMIIVLAREERVGQKAKEVSQKLREKYENIFHHILETEHPSNLSGEIPGKGSNTAWAGRKTKEYIDGLKVPYENILVSSLDIDTQVPKQYFLVITYHFLTVEDPVHTSYQPVPLYHNNIWEAPAFSRVVANSGSFWQMMQQERPERLATFSSHSMSFKALVEVDFWQKNMVSEDSRIFWQGLLRYKGGYKSQPLSYPVYMDANVGRNFQLNYLGFQSSPCDKTYHDICDDRYRYVNFNFNFASPASSGENSKEKIYLYDRAMALDARDFDYFWLDSSARRPNPLNARALHGLLGDSEV